MITSESILKSPVKEEIQSLFHQADGIMVVAANGFSISEGFAILRPSSWFSEKFSDFQRKYGFQAPIQAMTYPYSEPEEFGKFYSRLLKDIHYDKPVSPVMKDLQKVTDKLDCFVLTTNGEDRFVQAGYPEDHVFYMEGRFNHWKDHSYIRREDLDQLRSGSQLESDDFANSDLFRSKINDLNAFIVSRPRLLILELGVSARNGWLRPVVSQIMSTDPEAHCIELNQIPNPLPQAYTNRVLQISGNMQSSLEKLSEIV